MAAKRKRDEGKLLCDKCKNWMDPDELDATSAQYMCKDAAACASRGAVDGKRERTRNPRFYSS